MKLFEEIIKSLKNEHLRKNAILRFRELYRKHLISYAKQKYENEEEANQEIETSIKVIIYFISKYDFSPDESQTIKSLKKIIALSYYEKQLRIEMQRYISFQTTEYLAIEKKIRKIITPYFQLFTQKNYPNSLIYGDAGVLGNDWINHQAFEIYIHKLLGGDEQFFRNKITKLETFVHEMYMIFVLRYSKQETEQKRVLNKIYELCRIRFGYLRHTDIDTFAESMEYFLNEIKERDFILRTSLQRYWDGIYKTLIQKSFREGKKQNSTKTIKIYDNTFTKEEVYAFIYDGLEAIEHVHSGKAKILLLTGRKTHFIQLLQEASLFFQPTNYGIIPDYKNKQSEAQQRQDCKKALIEWMKAEVNSPNSNWYGDRGLAIMKFICES